MDTVIAAYDCQDSIGAAVRAFGTVGSVIVVDVGSVDNTADIAQLAGAVVVNGKGLDKGHAVSLGLRYVKTPRTILTDGDIRGFTSAHALAMAEPTESMLRGRITGSFKMTSGARRVLAPCLTATRALPTWLARAVDLSGLAYQQQLNTAATLCGIRTRFVNLDDLSPNADRAYYDEPLFHEWLSAVMSGDIVIRGARPELVRAVRRLGFTREAGG